MPRGVRKSEREKLEEKIQQIEESIRATESGLKEQKDEKKRLQNELDNLEYIESMNILKEYKISTDELKEMIQKKQMNNIQIGA